jgi:hypothetical protein
MNSIICQLLVSILTIGIAIQTSDPHPQGWKIRMDRPGFVSSEPYFVSMSPGWQLSTDSPVIAYETAKPAKGNYKLESEMFLFPGGQNEGYGLFIGGSSLDSNDLSYTAFELRRDGKFAVWSRKGPTTHEIVPWTSNPAILPFSGQTEPIKNVLAIDVRTAEIAFMVNGKTVYLSRRSAFTTDGNLGFHVNASLNVHASTLSLQSNP